MVLLVQVPLKQKNPMQFQDEFELSDTAVYMAVRDFDMEEAVIGHGKVEGPFTEIDGLDIERDDRYPIRVTVQFYQATSEGTISESQMTMIAEQIQRVYGEADYVGSLVVEGRAGRPTEYDGSHDQPPDWWKQFWQRHLANTGQSQQDAIAMLRKLLGDRWETATLADAESALGQYDRASG